MKFIYNVSKIIKYVINWCWFVNPNQKNTRSRRKIN